MDYLVQKSHMNKELERGRIVGLRETGLSFRDIAHHVNRGLYTVLLCCRTWLREHRTQRIRGS